MKHRELLRQADTLAAALGALPRAWTQAAELSATSAQVDFLNPGKPEARG